MRRRLLRILPGAAWAALLLLPAFSVAAHANSWELRPWESVGVTAWLVLAGWVLLPTRALLLATLPLVLAGIVVVAADFSRGADVLELISVAYTFRGSEVADALQPYLWPALGATAAVLLLLALLWKEQSGGWRSTRVRAAVVVAGALLALGLPAASWRAAWPGALLGAVLEAASGDTGLPATATPDSRASPRDRFATWHAQRAASPTGRETYVLVIGESLRSDRLAECGGRPQVTPAPAGALVFCDMLAGASGTHSAVPLLVSRALPGTRERIPRDGTFLKPFEAVGFETFWLAAQERMIAWPDARSQAFDPAPGHDRASLLPLLDQALARSEPRKALVLHAYGAHSPYGARYDAAQAPFAVDRARMQAGRPTREALAQWWNDYDNAVDESMRFLAAVIRRVEAGDDEAVVVFTPDHGENMLDDARELSAHALRRPTWWDTRVPMVVWASARWRAAHPERWAQLAANRQERLMHMDVVPTMLGAAGIDYLEPRPQAVDLTARRVPPGRERFTQVRPGEVLTEAVLREEAQLDPR